MIRNTYGRKHWTFPGGGMKKGELPEIAVLREVREEVGISLGSIKRIGEYKNNKEYKRDTVYCFYASIQKPEFFIDSSEILEAKWFAFSVIPNFRSPAVGKILNLL